MESTKQGLSKIVDIEKAFSDLGPVRIVAVAMYSYMSEIRIPGKPLFWPIVIQIFVLAPSLT